jgi:hypothetical protein
VNRLRRFSGVAPCLRACVWSVLLAGGALAQSNLEFEVKAAFLLNFAKFVDWSPNAFADAESPVAICILGKDPFGRVIDDLVQGEIVNGRPVVVRRLSQPPDPQACQVVFTEAEGRAAAKAMSGMGRGVLTVGEGDGFVREGGIIGFVIDNRRVRFDINQTAAENASLTLSSKLLSVARAVKK